MRFKIKKKKDREMAEIMEQSPLLKGIFRQKRLS